MDSVLTLFWENVFLGSTGLGTDIAKQLSIDANEAAQQLQIPAEASAAEKAYVFLGKHSLG